MARSWGRGCTAVALALASLAPRTAAYVPVAGTALGNALASGADVDGDGKPDLLVGCPDSDNGREQASRIGKVLVVSGANGNVLRTVEGGVAGERFGAALAFVGDANGHGVADFAVGAPLSSRPPREPGGGGEEHAGRVAVVSGKDGKVLGEIWGGAHEQFGTAVAVVPDSDKDDISDLLVGAPVSAPGGLADAGLARVLSTKTGRRMFQVEGGRASLFLGTAVAGVGDLNGDGIADLAVGGPAEFSGGEVRLCSGRDGALLRSLKAQEGWKWFGRALVGCGDWNRDGVPDLAVAAPGARLDGGKGTGLVLVFSGKEGGLLNRFDPPPGSREFGESVACPGDVDADGVPELCIGAPGSGTGKGPGSGSVRLLSGASGEALWAVDGTVSDARLGQSLACLSDLDGDGKPEIAMGAPGTSEVMVVSGRTGAVVRTVREARR